MKEKKPKPEVVAYRIAYRPEDATSHANAFRNHNLNARVFSRAIRADGGFIPLWVVVVRKGRVSRVATMLPTSDAHSRDAEAVARRSL